MKMANTPILLRFKEPRLIKQNSQTVTNVHQEAEQDWTYLRLPDRDFDLDFDLDLDLDDLDRDECRLLLRRGDAELETRHTHVS